MTPNGNPAGSSDVPGTPPGVLKQRFRCRATRAGWLVHALLGFAAALPSTAASKHGPAELLVGIKPAAPFVIVEDEVLSVESLQHALYAVESGEAVAAVHDDALMRYHLPRTTPGLVLVGRTFVDHGYEITFPSGSELREEINIALLELMEGDSSVYQQLVDRWFGR